MNCEYCQSPVHIWIHCVKKPVGWKPERLAKKSTAALMEVQAIMTGLIEDDAIDARYPKPPVAGTRALPVDTKSRTTKNEGSVLTSKAGLSKPLAVAGGDTERQTKFDKVAFQRKYMREVYRPKVKAKREEEKNG